MTAGHDDLLHADFDGELSPEERQRVRRLVQERPDVAERAAALATLGEWLETAGDAPPPANFVKTVMARLRPQVVPFRTPARTGIDGGRSMKKGLYGIAAAAAVAFAYLAISGWPPVDNIQGAIGAAKRHNSGQIAAGDVQVGDTAVQQFMQSDAFARLIQDEAAVRLLSNDLTRQKLAELSAMIQGTELRGAIKSADLAEALNSAEFRATFLKLELQQYLNAEFLAELQQMDLRQKLVYADLLTALKAPELATELRAGSKLMAELKAYPAMLKALTSADFQNAIRGQHLGAALEDQALRKVFLNAELMQMLRAPGLAEVFLNADFAQALKMPGFADTMLRADFAQALRSPQFAEQASLRGMRLNSELRAGQR